MRVQQFIPLVVQIPSNSITKSQAEALGVESLIRWQGPQISISGYVVVTQETWWGEFDEIGSTKRYFNIGLFPSPDSPMGIYLYISDVPLSGCSPKSGYGVKVKVDGFGEWGCKNVLTVV